MLTVLNDLMARLSFCSRMNPLLPTHSYNKFLMILRHKKADQKIGFFIDSFQVKLNLRLHPQLQDDQPAQHTPLAQHHLGDYHISGFAGNHLGDSHNVDRSQ